MISSAISSRHWGSTRVRGHPAGGNACTSSFVIQRCHLTGAGNQFPTANDVGKGKLQFKSDAKVFGVLKRKAPKEILRLPASRQPSRPEGGVERGRQRTGIPS